MNTDFANGDEHVVDWTSDFRSEKEFQKTKPLLFSFPNKQDKQLKDWINLPNELIAALLTTGRSEDEISKAFPSKPQINPSEKIAGSNIPKIVDLNRTNGLLRWCKELLTALNVDLDGVAVKYKRIEEKGDIEQTAKNFNNEIKGENIILYGVPGSGKSYTIKEKIGKLLGKNIKDKSTFDSEYTELWKNGNISRVVFHPDYTYSDFTGQILPAVENGEVKYEFKPGPFTKILKSACERKDESFFLIIEEINRGNAAAIFGDIFQLLDRNGRGESEYPIDNHDIAREIDENCKFDKIVIPSNLWLLATMNTSDQNVYTLDTAFQRRWNMELIPNTFIEGKHDFIIEDTGVTWREFALIVNEKLETGGALTSEDKRLGAWFISADNNDGTVSKKLFANKVIKYLWDDAFKFNRDDLFNTDKYKTLEKVIEKFNNRNRGGEKGFGDLFTIFNSLDTYDGEAENV